MTALDRIEAFIRAESLFEPGQTIVAGVSGGSDSLCLMHALGRLGYGVVAAHFDHAIRPGGADEAELVRKQAQAAGCTFVAGRGDVPAEAAASGEPLEAAARSARYRFLFRVATEHKLNIIATGHTRDDQVETVLMNLVRGSGLAGLAGMRPLGPIGALGARSTSDPPVQLARPLLCLAREQTEAYCRDQGLEPISDPSNQDRNFLRNRVRLDLIPELERYNPGVRGAVWRLAEVARGIEDWVTRAAQQAYLRAVREAGPNALALDEETFQGLDVAVQRQVLRIMLAQGSTPLREAGLGTVERLRKLVVEKRRGVHSVSGDTAFERVDGEWLLAPPETPARFPQFPLLHDSSGHRLGGSEVISLDAGWAIRCVKGPAPHADAVSGTESPPGRWAAVFDAQSAGELLLRPPCPGDRLAPKGMEGTVKLSDLFINHKIPRRLRARWPVVEAGGEILWVAGLRQSRLHPVTTSTRHVLRLTLAGPDPDERQLAW